MSLLSCKDLSLIRSVPLFAGLDLAVAKGDRIGLIAANGRGKSSLLSIFAGLSEPGSGSLTRARGLVVGFAPQDIPPALLSLALHEAVRTALPADKAEDEAWRVDVLLDELQVDESLRQRQVGALSGGWQRTLLMARAAVVEPDLLVLDEPTNHLDLGRIGVLERFLAALPRDCAVIAASHDRAFLDAVSNRTLFLRPEDSAIFSLPYSHALQALDEQDAARGRQFANDMRKVRALRQQAAKLKNIGVNSGSDLLVVKTRQLSQRADLIEERSRPEHRERSAGTIRLSASDTHAKALVRLDNAAINAPDGRLLFRTGKLWIQNGDRVALLGPNGAGKTQLVSRVQRATRLPDPEIHCAASLRPGMSDQALSQLDAFPTAWEAVKQTSTLGDHEARAQLAGAGIAFDAQSWPLVRLSGGQKARLAMLVLRLLRPNFFLLDEPTNHLDIEGQEMLEAELLDQGVACLLVSHDRAFVRAVATRIWMISGRQLVEVDDPDPIFDRLLKGQA